ncbi:MAG: hypothetical protein WCL14_04410 [Bacteroidota bacterium]
MKRLLLFILISASSIGQTLVACGYYPYGEDVRFRLLNPYNFYYDDYSPFYYSSAIFTPKSLEIKPSYQKEMINSLTKQNIELWRKRYNNIPEEKDVYEAIYLLKNEVDFPNDPNKFIQLLNKNKDYDAIQYLLFAKRCEQLNSMIDDPWERDEYARLPQRSVLISQAIEKAKELKDVDLKHRYAFLAIRLSYYNEKSADITKIYDEFFGTNSPENIIDYWSLYFKALSLQEGPERNYLLSVVFQNAPDKRFMTNYHYEKSIAIESTLSYAKTNRDKAAVWLLAGIKNPAKAYESISNIYVLDPHSDGLSFLLLREINKLEDWIYTPYYTYFDPSISSFDEGSNNSKDKNMDRVKNDREYARKLLDFVNSANLDKIENKILWKTAKSYLYFMIENYNSSLTEISSLQNGLKKEEVLYYQLETIKALCLTAKQENGKAEILDAVKPILMRQYDSSNYKFIFAVARELEYKRNTIDAALLMSKIGTNDKHPEYVFGREFDAMILWKSKNGNNTLRDDYFYEYFFYMDAEYTPEQTKAVIDDVLSNNKTDAFSVWKYENVKKDISRLYDLLGTKYMRKDDLDNALNYFQKVKDDFWHSKDQPYLVYLAANPFYTNMYNEHSITKADTVHYTKTTIVQTLKNYLKKAEDPMNKDRSYYFFLVANCYLNMTQYGNSWMMKRYYWSSSEYKSNLEDDDEYFQCDLAKVNYLKANATSKNRKFAALCLRMAGRCEKYRLISTDTVERWNYKGDDFETKIFNNNLFYNQLKTDYSEYYHDLISNCESFDNYFNSRN